MQALQEDLDLNDFLGREIREAAWLVLRLDCCFKKKS